MTSRNESVFKRINTKQKKADIQVAQVKGKNDAKQPGCVDL